MGMPPVVLITGASSGVGAAAAEAFAAAGHDVALIARSQDGLETVAERVRDLGQQALVLPCDVTDVEGLETAVQRTEDELGSLDVLVLNAAITVFGPFKEVPAEDFERVVQVTFLGAVNTTRVALPALERAGGVIVGVGSLNSRVPLPAWSSYCAAKHAERGFLNTLAIELKAQQSPVQVAQLHPGQINTPVWTDTHSVTGELPRRPPEGYAPEAVAEALVTLSRDPRPETLFGLEAIALDRLWRTVRPVGDAVMTAIFHYFQSGNRKDQGDLDALRDAVGKGVVRDGFLLQRPSVSSVARGLISAARLPVDWATR